MQVTESFLLSSVPRKEAKIVNENCIHFCLNSTKGDVDLEESDGFLGFLIPSMNPLDRISSLSQKAKCCYPFADYSKKHATRLSGLYRWMGSLHVHAKGLGFQSPNGESLSKFCRSGHRCPYPTQGKQLVCCKSKIQKDER